MLRELVILGSGGGRFVTMTQQRRTGGLLLEFDDGYFVVDPGPSSLIQFNQMGFRPFSVDAILISHRHPDHYADAEVYVEAMTQGGNAERGLLAAAKSVVEEVSLMGYPAISNYHLGLPERVVSMGPGDLINYNGVSIKGTKLFHTDPYAIGFLIGDGTRTVAYVADTEYSPEAVQGMENADLLIISVLRPSSDRFKGHLCTEDAVKLVQLTTPKQVLLTHFGARMLRADPEREAEEVTRRTGIPTVAAKDGLRLSVGQSTL